MKYIFVIILLIPFSKPNNLMIKSFARKQCDCYKELLKEIEKDKAIQRATPYMPNMKLFGTRKFSTDLNRECLQLKLTNRERTFLENLHSIQKTDFKLSVEKELVRICKPLRGGIAKRETR